MVTRTRLFSQSGLTSFKSIKELRESLLAHEAHCKETLFQLSNVRPVLLSPDRMPIELGETDGQTTKVGFNFFAFGQYSKALAGQSMGGLTLGPNYQSVWNYINHLWAQTVDQSNGLYKVLVHQSEAGQKTMIAFNGSKYMRVLDSTYLSWAIDELVKAAGGEDSLEFQAEVSESGMSFYVEWPDQKVEWKNRTFQLALHGIHSSVGDAAIRLIPCWSETTCKNGMLIGIRPYGRLRFEHDQVDVAKAETEIPQAVADFVSDIENEKAFLLGALDAAESIVLGNNAAEALDKLLLSHIPGAMDFRTTLEAMEKQKSVLNVLNLWYEYTLRGKGKSIEARLDFNTTAGQLNVLVQEKLKSAN